MGQESIKILCMPNGTVEAARNMGKLQNDLCHPAKDVHVVPSIKCNLLLSMSKLVDANYVAFF
jgi:hypothetical protein